MRRKLRGELNHLFGDLKNDCGKVEMHLEKLRWDICIRLDGVKRIEWKFNDLDNKEIFKLSDD